MWLLNIFKLFCFVSLAGSYSYAEDSSSLRISAVLGLGQGAAQSGGVTRVEGPLGLGATVDYSMTPRMTIGAEHHRTFGSGSTAIGFTGLGMKFYFWTPQPQVWMNTEDQITKSYFLQKNFVPYAGTSVGFAQASIPGEGETPSVLVVGPYVSLKGGLEFPVVGRWGSRSEFVYGTSMAGSGQAEMLYLWFGFYYFL